MTNHDLPDYSARQPPDPATDDLEDASYHDRRAFVYAQIMEEGGPAYINQTEIAELFDVDQSQISRDVTVLAEQNFEHTDANKYRWSVSALLRKAGREAAEDGDVREMIAAAKALADWGERAGFYQGQDAERVEASVATRKPPFTDADGNPTWISDKNQAHFDRLIEESTKATAANTSAVSTTEYDEEWAAKQR